MASLALVYQRVPDRSKYGPLPDLFLDNVPATDWALDSLNYPSMEGQVDLSAWSGHYSIKTFFPFISSLCVCFPFNSAVGTCFSFPISFARGSCDDGASVKYPEFLANYASPAVEEHWNKKGTMVDGQIAIRKIVLQNQSIGHYETQISTLKSYLESKFLHIFSRTFSRTFFNRTWTWTFFNRGYEDILNDFITLR